jgi:N-acyl homoserine lactone hydrolase
MVAIHRLDFGYFIRPGSETADGRERAEPVLGYLIEHPDGDLLVDTGMGEDDWVDGHYQPRRVPLAAALHRAGRTVGDIAGVINCHLHFDHCGGNPQLPHRPIFTQRLELDIARETEYTLPALIDAPGLDYVELDGETEIRPGVLIVPTPGHSVGHQSVVVRQPDGTVVVAGQSHDSATAYGTDVLNHHAHVGRPPAWIATLQRLDPRRVVFAHDHAVWEP